MREISRTDWLCMVSWCSFLGRRFSISSLLNGYLSQGGDAVAGYCS